MGRPCQLGSDHHGHRAPLAVPLISLLFLEPFARLAVWCALSSYSSHKGQASSHQKKRHREDIEVRDPSSTYSRVCSADIS